MVRVLYLENTVPEYRVDFYKLIAGKFNVRFFFFKPDPSHKANLEQLKNNGLSVSKDCRCETLFKEAKKSDACVIAVNYFSLTHWLLLLYLHLIRKPTVLWTEVWWWPEHGIGSISRIVRLCFIFLSTKLSDNFAVAGVLHKRYLMKCGANENRIWIVPYTAEHSRISENVEPTEYSTLSPWMAARKRILYLARIEKYKGCDLLLKAFALMQPSDSWLLVVGSGTQLAECKRLAQNLQLQNALLVGSISNGLRSLVLENCSVYVLPSRQDPWPISLIEAIDHNCPVLVSDGVGNYPELVRGNGLVFRHCDIEDLSVKLQYMLETDVKLYREKALQVASLFTLSRSAKSMIQAIEQALCRK